MSSPLVAPPRLSALDGGAARLMVEAQPGHSWAEGLVSLLGALRRIGQAYRELRWRCGERRALVILAELLFALPP